MKYKNLTKEQIIISLDRLTRFKNTREKYIRVFSDILISNLIEPKYKKLDIEVLDLNSLVEYASTIINESLEVLYKKNVPRTDLINKFLKNYENSIFNNDDETQILLNNNINYNKAVFLITEDSPINLKWLIKISENLNNNFVVDFKNIREKYLLKYPIEKIILVEGITEEILLPVFSRILNYDFYKNGIQIIPAGGKNQVVKMYYKLAEEVKIPIFILLDKDAEDNITQITPKLRKFDSIHLVSCGEFEDLLPKSLIVKTVNLEFKNFLTISQEDFLNNISTVKTLEEIFKTKALHEFKKAEFAKKIKDNIINTNDISDEIIEIVSKIKL